MSRIICGAFAVLSIIGNTFAQGVADPLTYQGLESLDYMNARTRAMGGAAVSSGSDVGGMFANPAALSQLSAFQIRTGSIFGSVSYNQVQRWNPNRFYADLSLMFENKFEGIKEPDVPSSPADNLHKPFDNLTPGWDKSLSGTHVSSVTAGLPLPEFSGIKVSAGIGWAEMADLNYFYQNNNAISPNLGQYRPAPIPVVAVGDTLPVQWFQFIRQRQGAVYGITPALSISPCEGLYFGFSASILTGSVDDQQIRVDRGSLRLLYNTYFLDSAFNAITTTGTSKIRGTLPMIGVIVKQQYYALGVSLKPASTIYREWSQSTETKGKNNTQTVATHGTDTLKLPWLYTVGVTLYPTEKWCVAVDYAVKSLSDAIITPENGIASNPMVNGKEFRVGVEYQLRKWIYLRAGARQDVRSFAPSGAGLVNEPAEGAVYSAGFGLHFGRFSFDGAFEYGTLRYNDLWQSNVNTNRVTSNTGSLEIGYSFE